MTGLPDNIRSFLERKNLAFLATLNRDGSPHLTPNWVDTDGEYVLINTAVGRAKEKNTRRDARVAVSVAEQSDPYRYVTIVGRVVDRITGEPAEKHIDKLAKKYEGVETFPRTPGMRRIILKIKPERFYGQGL